MFGEVLSSTTDYIKTRLTNPFLGTLLAVWIIRNFAFLYALFNFADGVTLTQKEDYIRRYFQAHGFWSELGCNIFIALLILSLSFIMLLLTRAITNGYSWLLNELNKKTDKGSVVSRDDYNSLKKQSEIIKKQRDQLNTEANLHAETVKNLEDKLQDAYKTINERESKLRELDKNYNLYPNKEESKEINRLASEFQYRYVYDSDEGNLTEKYTIYNDDRVRIGNWINYNTLPKWLTEQNIGRITEAALLFIEGDSFKTMPETTKYGIKYLIRKKLIFDFLATSIIISTESIMIDIEYVKRYLDFNLFKSLDNTLDNIIMSNSITLTEEGNALKNYVFQSIESYI